MGNMGGPPRTRETERERVEKVSDCLEHTALVPVGNKGKVKAETTGSESDAPRLKAQSYGVRHFSLQ
ncbi:hypothetical protein ACLOJK_032181 [Asimina triloba]